MFQGSGVTPFSSIFLNESIMSLTSSSVLLVLLGIPLLSIIHFIDQRERCVFIGLTMYFSQNCLITASLYYCSVLNTFGVFSNKFSSYLSMSLFKNLNTLYQSIAFVIPLGLNFFLQNTLDEGIMTSELKPCIHSGLLSVRVDQSDFMFLGLCWAEVLKDQVDLFRD